MTKRGFIIVPCYESGNKWGGVLIMMHNGKKSRAISINKNHLLTVAKEYKKTRSRKIKKEEIDFCINCKKIVCKGDCQDLKDFRKGVQNGYCKD